jgi:hypothetical protein
MGRAATVAAVGWLLAGCGGDRGSPRYTSGLDGLRPLGELDTAELGRLCKSAQAWATDAIPVIERATFLCKTSAVLAGALAGTLSRGAVELRTACEDAYEGCLRRSDMAPAAIACPRPGPDCVATVAEYERCLNDFPASFDDAIAAIPSCRALTLASVAQAGAAAAAALPDSCAAFQQRCPGVRVTGLPTGP